MNLEHLHDITEAEELARWDRDEAVHDHFSPARVAHFLETLPPPQRREWLGRFRHLTRQHLTS